MRSLLLYLILFCSFQGVAQSYYPFPDSVGVWRQASIFDNNFPSPPSITPYNLFLLGDTIINSLQYSKLYFDGNGPYNYNIDTVGSVCYGAIRESNKKVYFYPDSTYNYTFGTGFCYNWLNPVPNINQELLLYDFSVNVGDTVTYSHLNNLKIRIDSIDSILIQTQYRKRFYFSLASFWDPICNGGLNNLNHYIEGIGEVTSGLLGFWYYYFENAESFACFEDDEIFYGSPFCHTLNTEELDKTPQPKIFPNPATDKLNIEQSGYKIIRLYNLSGKLVYSSSSTSSVFTLNTSGYPKGLYLMLIISENRTFTEKVSIQ